MSQQKKAAVIGSGIAGLCTAYWLRQKGLDVQVFEKSDRPGGVIVSERQEGFLVDLGPNSTLETSETLTALVRDLGLEQVKVYGNQASQKRYILRDGRLMAVPTSPLAFLGTSLFSWKAKLRLLREPFIGPSPGEDISLADFVSHRLGQEFLDYAINPFVAGVYAGDPKTLSTASGFPKLYALEKNYGSLIKGAIGGARERKRRKEVAKDRARMFSFTEGMQTFTDALAARLKGHITTNTTVSGVSRQGDQFRLTVDAPAEPSAALLFDQVVICVPTFAMSGLLQSIAPAEAASLAEVYYPPVSVVFTGFREKDIRRPLDGFGFLVPEVEQRNILGSLWSSTIFPGRAPAGHVAFTTFVGGTRQPDNALLPEEVLRDLVLRELKALGIVSGDPVFVRIKKWNKAIPQYRLGYGKVQKLFDDLERQFPGLFFAGNFRRGISVGDSVLSAQETVAKINSH